MKLSVTFKWLSSWFLFEFYLQPTGIFLFPTVYFSNLFKMKYEKFYLKSVLSFTYRKSLVLKLLCSVFRVDQIESGAQHSCMYNYNVIIIAILFFSFLPFNVFPMFCERQCFNCVVQHKTSSAELYFERPIQIIVQ